MWGICACSCGVPSLSNNSPCPELINSHILASGGDTTFHKDEMGFHHLFFNGGKTGRCGQMQSAELNGLWLPGFGQSFGRDVAHAEEILLIIYALCQQQGVL